MQKVSSTVYLSDKAISELRVESKRIEDELREAKNKQANLHAEVDRLQESQARVNRLLYVTASADGPR